MAQPEVDYELISRIKFSPNDGPFRRWFGRTLVHVGFARDLVGADQSQTLFEIREGIIQDPTRVETSTTQGRTTVVTTIRRRLQ